jgi:serine/threonine-protein kinase
MDVFDLARHPAHHEGPGQAVAELGHETADRRLGAPGPDAARIGEVSDVDGHPTAQNTLEDMIGTLLNGRFRLEEQVGSGGMSTVYRAFDETLERWVAIKVMHADLSSDADQLERFRREARAAARLSHPHVVTVIDAGEDDGHPYIVFEYVEGETLKQRIRRLGRLDVGEAVAYAIEIGRALAAAHTERIVHRDVKPQNVLIDTEGRAKVTDFGIARSLELDGLTAAGRVLGTTDYVSPEQALGEPVTEQSDVYSLGICLFEMLTGDVPFKAESQVAVAMKHVREPVPDVQHLRPDVSASLAAVVEQATAKETENRYASTVEMVEDLEHALAIEVARSGHAGGEATTVLRALRGDTADFVPLRLRRPGRVLAIALLALAAAAAIVIVLAGRTEKGTPSATPQPAAGLDRVALASDAPSDYDPEGDGEEHPDSVREVVDGNRSTGWDTESYSGGLDGSDKGGVGLYVDAGSEIAARRLDLVNSIRGWQAQVFAATSAQDEIGGWTAVSQPFTADDTNDVPLDTGGRHFSHYLVWITQLPDEGQAGILELSLLR